MRAEGLRDVRAGSEQHRLRPALEVAWAPPGPLQPGRHLRVGKEPWPPQRVYTVRTRTETELCPAPGACCLPDADVEGGVPSAEPDAGGKGGFACGLQVLDQGPGVGLSPVTTEHVRLGCRPCSGVCRPLHF